MPNGPLRAEALRAKAVSALSHCLLQASQVVLEELLQVDLFRMPQP